MNDRIARKRRRFSRSAKRGRRMGRQRVLDSKTLEYDPISYL